MIRRIILALISATLLGGFLTSPGSAAIADSKYEADWRSITGEINSSTPLSCRGAAWRDFYFGDCTSDDPENPGTALPGGSTTNVWRGNDYQLYGIPDGTTVGIYIKGGTDTSGLCDPVLMIYDVTNPNRSDWVQVNDDSGRGGNDGSGYNGWTCDSDQTSSRIPLTGGFDNRYDSFLSIAWSSNYRIHATTYWYFGELVGPNPASYEGGKGSYTIYISTGLFEQPYQWQGKVSIDCPEANPWKNETLDTAQKVNPLSAGGDNIVGQFAQASALESLGASGVEFSVGDSFVQTATSELPNYGCSDHLINAGLNQPIQLIAGGFTLQSDAHGYINTQDEIWHDVGSTTLFTNTAAFFHVIEFTRPGRYEIVITEAPDTTALKVPTFGQKSVRFVVIVE